MVRIPLRLLATLAGICLLAGCGSTAAPQAAEQPLIAKDANGTPIIIPAVAPQHIISLGPTDSEILAALGATAQVIGVDAFTDYPASMAAKPKVTDANGKANIEQIVGLEPDLVLSFGGEIAATDQQLEQLHINVVDLPAPSLAGTLTEIRLVGQLIHAESAANALATSMQQRIAAVQAKVAGAAPVSVYMEVGYTPPPPYVFGGGSFGDGLITAAGGTNIFSQNRENGGYPTVSEESIITANPQVIILTEDPAYGGDPANVYQRANWAGIAAVKNHRVYAINPDLVQRPGPRLVDALDQLAQDIHPDRF